jgi:hypothetical protein
MDRAVLPAGWDRLSTCWMPLRLCRFVKIGYFSKIFLIFLRTRPEFAARICSQYPTLCSILWSVWRQRLDMRAELLSPWLFHSPSLVYSVSCAWVSFRFNLSCAISLLAAFSRSFQADYPSISSLHFRYIWRRSKRGSWPLWLMGLWEDNSFNSQWICSKVASFYSNLGLLFDGFSQYRIRYPDGEHEIAGHSPPEEIWLNRTEIACAN